MVTGEIFEYFSEEQALQVNIDNLFVYYPMLHGRYPRELEICETVYAILSK